MLEVRIHGRGGQGAVVASKILALAAFKEGRHVQSFPAFGVERRGAPVAAFTRIDDRPILLHCGIYEPDHLIVLDPTLTANVDVIAGLKEGGLVLVNSPAGEGRYLPSLPGRVGECLPPLPLGPRSVPSASGPEAKRSQREGGGEGGASHRFRLAVVDASAIAVRHHLGSPLSPIVSTAIVGAFARATGVVGLEAVLAAVREVAPSAKEANVAAAKEAYEQVEV